MKEENIKGEYQRKVDKSLIPTCNIMGVNIAAINMNWLLKYLDENLSDIKGDYICVSNVHTTVTSYENAAYCAVQNGGLMAIPDGGPLSSVGRKRGYSDMDRTTGPSLMGEIFKISAEKGYRHYFYGSTEETLKLLEEKLQENYPGIQIAGMYSPPFRPLTEEEDKNIIENAVEEFFATEKPEYVFLAAAKVGGIVANQEALADFMYENMVLEMNVIHSAWKNGCKKLEFLGSSCIYPRMAPQPMKESCLLTSELEKTNEAYALAKISGLKYCEFLNKQYGTDYISVMPTNLYGPNDNYHPTHSHVLPALIRRFHEAKVNGLKEVTCWGDGSPLREFLYVDDLANLCVFLMNNYSGDETVNAGTGKELTIKELTELVAKVIGYEGEIKWDSSKPNGTPRKLLDVSKATNLGWTYKTELEEGIRLSYEDFLNNPMRAER